MKTRFLAIFVIALCFRAVNTEAAVGSPLPNRLSIGSDAALKEGAVTNGSRSATTLLYYTNNAGQLKVAQLPQGQLQFVSYEAFRMYAISNASKVFNAWKTNMDGGTTLRWIALIGYIEPVEGNAFYSLISDVKIGPISTITSNLFATSLNLTNNSVIVPVSGLQGFSVEVRGVYTNHWPTTSGRTGINIVQPPPPELTTNNVVVMNPWYCRGTNATEVRISISAGGTTAWYTQSGDRLGPSTLSMTNNLSCSFARGAIVQIESSTNLTSWSTVTNFSDLGKVGFISIPINRNRPREFFRVGTR